MRLLIHPVTDKRLQAFVAKPSHALLLVGPKGSGKRSLAEELASTVLGIEAADWQNYPYKLVLSPLEGKTIGIEAIRELEHLLRLTVPKTSGLSRVVLVEAAETMTAEAQNALLKLLEEPPADSLFILTVSHLHGVLPTVRSRAQTIDVLSPSAADMDDFFQQAGFEPGDINRMRLIGGGLPGLMSSLLSDSEHPLQQATVTARQLLSASSYDRLLLVDELAKQPALLDDTLFIMQHMAHLSLAKAEGPAAQKWQRVLEASYQAREALRNSAQAKLVLLELMLAL